MGRVGSGSAVVVDVNKVESAVTAVAVTLPFEEATAKKMAGQKPWSFLLALLAAAAPIGKHHRG